MRTRETEARDRLVRISFRGAEDIFAPRSAPLAPMGAQAGPAATALAVMTWDPSVMARTAVITRVPPVMIRAYASCPYDERWYTMCNCKLCICPLCTDALSAQGPKHNA